MYVPMSSLITHMVTDISGDAYVSVTSSVSE